ncbi:MAG: 1-deoxy-D-xylulose-5-phosphate reductoisomerase [Bacteroidota bacterium]
MEEKKTGVAILGSTGSIGTQALEVIAANRDFFTVEILSAQSNAELLISQALEYKANAVVIGDESKYEQVKEALWEAGIKTYAGEKALAEVVAFEAVDVVLTAMVGYAGLIPTMAAIEAGKTIALANKETLVVAGDIVTEAARKKGVNIYPVDSEHSAIFQCLVGEFHNPVEKIILTASGGPFRGKKTAELESITRDMALKHPNWTMGAKITIDSSTLMNKGLEVIEAKWLFGLQPSQIDVIVHPQSIIHSMVQFCDGSIKAQMGLPDMKLPIQFALGYPKRLPSTFPRFDFLDYPNLSFEKPDRDTFRCLDLAFAAMEVGGNMACVMNAANEIAVDAFLNERIAYLEIPRLVEKTMEKASFLKNPSLADYVASNEESRRLAADFI